MKTGYLLFVLHAHLPYIRHVEDGVFHEEKWLFEAISETYLPLFRLFKKLKMEGIPFKVTLSVSPTLSEMLEDNLIQDKYTLYLEKQIELAGKEVRRNKGDAPFQKMAEYYHELYKTNYKEFVDDSQGHLFRELAQFLKSGNIELITSCATHNFMPLFENYPQAQNAQVQMALDSHQRIFGKKSNGFWLPECGYYPGLEDMLREKGIDYFFASPHALLHADNVPEDGVFSPIQCPNRTFVFAREKSLSNAVWSFNKGYPGDLSYRDYYKDIGFDLPMDYVGEYLPGDNVRSFTGFKYYAITGSEGEKKPYDFEAASKKVKEHADNFLYKMLKQVNKVGRHMENPPVMVCTFDAELFGHWWFEGIQWLESVIRKMHTGYKQFEMINGMDYIRRHEKAQVIQPAFSSWGTNGYAGVWLDGSNDWIYRHLHKAIERMSELVERFPDVSGPKLRALSQAAREVLLAQSSDWAYIIKGGTNARYAAKRVKEHIINFTKIYDFMCGNVMDSEWLTNLERQNCIFPNIDYKMFAK